MGIALWLAGAAVLAALVWLGVRAYRDEYLMVLYWEESGALFYERRDGERYRPIPPALLPLAAVRYGWRSAGTALARTRTEEKRVGRGAPAALAHR